MAPWLYNLETELGPRGYELDKYCMFWFFFPQHPYPLKKKKGFRVNSKVCITFLKNHNYVSFGTSTYQRQYT